jgi:hypothetical protein
MARRLVTAFERSMVIIQVKSYAEDAAKLYYILD